MATNLSPVIGVLRFKPIPKYCNVCFYGILHISQWSDTGSPGPLVTNVFSFHQKFHHLPLFVRYMQSHVMMGKGVHNVLQLKGGGHLN